MDFINKKSVEYNLNLGLGGGGGKYWQYKMYSEYIEQIGKIYQGDNNINIKN